MRFLEASKNIILFIKRISFSFASHCLNKANLKHNNHEVLTSSKVDISFIFPLLIQVTFVLSYL